MEQTQTNPAEKKERKINPVIKYSFYLTLIAIAAFLVVFFMDLPFEYGSAIISGVFTIWAILALGIFSGIIKIFKEK